MSKILIAEDDPCLRKLLADFFQDKGDEVIEATDGAEAVHKLEEHIFDLILAELRLPGKSGIDVLRAAKSSHEPTPVLMLTGPTEAAAALEALKLGACDYLLTQTPLNLDEIRLRADKALECHRLVTAMDYLKQTQPYLGDGERIIGHSAQLRKALASVKKETSTTSTILIKGEPGTGKALLAAAIHANSPRRERTFVTVTCAALPEHLLESDLFGHEKGAFSGAGRQRIGGFAQANLGTLLLREIGALGPGTQQKVLRVLRHREFELLGGSKTMSVDVRVIAATNRDLKQAIREGRFRSDLYARLNVISVEIPSLQERPEDIIPLAHFFLQKYGRLFGRRVKGFDAAAQKALLSYPWPGNMRELENTVERCVLLAKGELIGLSGLGTIVRQAASGESEDRVVKLPPRGISLKEIERQAIVQALQRTNWVQKEAAALLDITPRVMNYKLKTHGISHPKWPKRR